jgi:lactoylglutathione lyase
MAETLGRELQPPALDAPGFELGFKVDDCDAAYDELVSAGATPAVAPMERPWGQRTAYVRDPDGHLVELAQDLD